MAETNARIILFFGVLAVTSSSFIIRFADQLPYALAFTRVFFTGSISYLLLIRQDKSDYQITLTDSLKIFLAGTSLASHFGWWFDSLNYIPISASLSLTNTAPVWLAFLIILVYKKIPTTRQWISICFVIIGSFILFSDSPNLGEFGLRGLTLALLSAIGFAIYLLIAKDMVTKIGLWRYFGLVNLSSALVFVPWLVFRNEFNALNSSDIWFWGILLALIPGIMGHAVYNWAMSKVDPVDVGIATLGEPILGTIFAWIIFQEALSATQFVGVTLLIIAIAFTIDFRKK